VEEDSGVATVEVTAGVETAEEEDSEAAEDSVVEDWGAVMAAEDSGAVVVMVMDSEAVDSVAVGDLVVGSEAVDSVAAYTNTRRHTARYTGKRDCFSLDRFKG
jgi:3-hydroxyisobutyrate dehydrogenase-like beta-hydroxyacid dehydrogenase